MLESTTTQTGNHEQPVLPVRTSLSRHNPDRQVGAIDDSRCDEKKFAQVLSLTLSVNDQTIRLQHDLGELDGQGTIPVVVGDNLQVECLDFISIASGGVFAAEGYIVKPEQGHQQVLDFNDGRFSLIDDQFVLANGNLGLIDGLIGSWDVRSGWNELQINLMHYTTERTRIAASVVIPLQIH